LSVVDGIKQVADWLSDGSLGVNTMVGAIPGESSALPQVVIYNSVDHAWAARGVIEREQIPQGGSGWIMVVSRVGEIETNALAEHAKAASVAIPILVRVAARLTTTNTVVRYAEQYVRCARRAISRVWNDSTFAEILRNGVVFDAPTFRDLDVWQQPGDDAVVGALVVSLPALDAWVLGRST
jgi:hypothetical protein